MKKEFCTLEILHFNTVQDTCYFTGFGFENKEVVFSNNWHEKKYSVGKVFGEGKKLEYGISKILVVECTDFGAKFQLVVSKIDNDNDLKSFLKEVFKNEVLVKECNEDDE